jgi:hypothetical protein
MQALQDMSQLARFIFLDSAMNCTVLWSNLFSAVSTATLLVLLWASDPTAKLHVSSVGIVTDYGLEGRGVGVRVPVGTRIFSSPRRPDRLWGPAILLTNGCRVLFPRG